MRWALATWGQSKEETFSNIEKSLLSLGHECSRFRRDCSEGRTALLEALESNGFDGVITWQRFYPRDKAIRSKIHELRLKTVYLDFGFVPHYRTAVFDCEGENAQSSWPTAWQRGGVEGVTEADLSNARSLIERESNRTRSIAAPDLLNNRQLTQPFIFVPLQRSCDAVIRYDAAVPPFPDIVRRILMLAKEQFSVVFKVHPIDHGEDIGVPDYVSNSHLVVRTPVGKENDRMTDYLIANASLVVGINSNMLFKAAVVGVPVVALGRGWFTNSGVFTEVDDIRRLQHLKSKLVSYDTRVRYVAACLSRQMLISELDQPAKIEAMLAKIGAV